MIERLKKYWVRFSNFMTEETPKDKYSKRCYIKTFYMRRVQSNLFFLTLVAIGSFIPDPLFMSVFFVLVISWSIAWYYDAKFDREYQNPLNSVNKELLKRYKTLALENKDLDFEVQQEILKMTNVALKHTDNWPEDKTSRWIGYAQGVLIQNKVTTVDAERDFSRPLFHRAYKRMGYNVPESVDINNDNNNKEEK
jgi:hypothetical protein